MARVNPLVRHLSAPDDQRGVRHGVAALEMQVVSKLPKPWLALYMMGGDELLLGSVGPLPEPGHLHHLLILDPEATGQPGLLLSDGAQGEGGRGFQKLPPHTQHETLDS